MNFYDCETGSKDTHTANMIVKQSPTLPAINFFFYTLSRDLFFSYGIDYES